MEIRSQTNNYIQSTNLTNSTSFSISIEKSNFIYILKIIKEIFTLRTFSSDNNFKNLVNDKEYEIFNGDFDISAIELLKHEERELIQKNVDKNSEFYYTSRQNVSKIDIIHNQNLFNDLLDKIINLIDSNLKEQLLTFKTKLDFKRFFERVLYEKDSKISSAYILSNLLVLKVIKKYITTFIYINLQYNVN